MFQPPRSLVDAVRQRTLVPFIGAGVSVGVVRALAPDQRFPDWNGLIERLATRLEAENKTADAQAVRQTLPDSMAAAELAVSRLGRPAFLDEMVRAFGRSRPPVGANLSAPTALWRLQPPFVITTNYDQVLEWPWEPGGVQRIHNDDPTYLAALDQPDGGLRRIWYLHGSIGRVDTLILTSDQYLKLYPDGDPKRVEYQNAFNQLQHLLASRSFLFAGFSLTEPVLRRKLEEVLALTAHAAPIKFLLLKAGEADAAKQQDFLDRFNVQVVEFEDFGDPMVAAIDAIGREAWPSGAPVAHDGLTAEMTALVDSALAAAQSLALDPAVVARTFNATKPDGWSHALTGGDGITLLGEAIVQLGGALQPGEHGLPPLLDFVDRLLAETTEPWTTRLTAWVADAVVQLGGDDPGRATLRTLLQQTRTTAPTGSVHVLVRIAPGGTGEWLVHAWLWAGVAIPESLFDAEGRRFKEGSSADVVYALIDELEARSVNPDDTSIAFLVPNALACEAIHGWRLAESVAHEPPIGTSYTVTIRPLERLARAPLIRRRFKRAWDELKRNAAQMLAVLDPASPAPTGGAAAMFLDASGALRSDLPTMVDREGIRCVMLREPPCATALAQLTAVIDTTAPAILWYRDATALPAHVEQALRAVLEAGTIADLPRRVREERLKSFADATGAHDGMNLTLIWDDADYLPPEHDRDARAVVETI